MSDILDKLCRIEYDTELDCVVFAWQGYATSANLRQIFERILEMLQHYKCQRVISDSRNLLAMSADDQQWMIQNFVPRLKAAGLRYSAIIQPTSTAVGIAVENVVNSIDPDEIQQRYFHSMDEAKEWIKTIPST